MLCDSVPRQRQREDSGNWWNILKHSQQSSEKLERIWIIKQNYKSKKNLKKKSKVKNPKNPKWNWK